MEKLKEELWNTLQELKEEEFTKFKWFLNVLGHIPKAHLEKAERHDTVDLMVQKYQGCEALEITLTVLKKISRNDLVVHLQDSCSRPRGTLREGGAWEKECNKAKLKWVQQFAVEVTLDPDTAHPNLILSDNGKQVHHGDVRKNLPDNPKRFKRCVNVLGKQSFSSGSFYFEVEVKGKTAWALGVAKGSIARQGDITARPKNGYWTIMLRDGDHEANDEDPVHLSLNHHPQTVGVFVDYEKGVVFFYDVDTTDLIYSFTGCSFTEELFPFFSPWTNDGGINAAPLILTPVNHPLNLKRHNFDDQREEYERKKAELLSVQQFAVEVTLDPDTAHPALFLSDDGKQVHAGDVYKKLPYNPKRFKKCVNVLGKQSFSSGRFYFEVQVKGKTAWDLGVASESINRKENITTNPENGYWTIILRNRDEYKAIDDPSVHLSLKSQPERVGVFVDYEEGLVSFYDVNTADLLYSFTGCSFTEKLFPFFSPCTNNGGINSAPLIISPLNHLLNLKTQDFEDQREYEKKKAELMRIQQFAVEVTLDPDTAHPNVILSKDGKQVHHGDVRKNLLDNPKRFKRCVNVLGKENFSSGQFYFEVEVKGKTAWALGVAKGSIGREGDITLSPKNGYWTIMLRDGDHEANDNNSVHLSLNHHPQTVGVFVDYEEGLVSFYDVDTADLLYSFTGCSFTENLFPFFSPCTNNGGINAAPLIISPLNHLLNLKTHDFEDQKEYEKKKAELTRVQQFAVEVTLDPDTAHPHLILSNNGKQVHHGDVRKKLPYNPKRFNICVNVLGKESFSSGRFYFEVQVKGKTSWDLGVASESINRKENITTYPENGYWTIILRNRDEYKAVDDPSVHLSLKSQPERVGVFVDYEEGLVSFYDVDTADLLYSFNECLFTENLFPYFSPCTNDNGRNSAPLIICPVNHSK